MSVAKSQICRLLVWAAAFGWGVSIIGTLLPWEWMEFVLQGMGKSCATDDPMIRYHFRMATGGWSIIGFLYLCCALNPRKYASMLPLLAWGALFEGVILLIHGLALGLAAFPFLGDVAFCFVTGGGILLCTTKNAAP